MVNEEIGDPIITGENRYEPHSLRSGSYGNCICLVDGVRVDAWSKKWPDIG